MIHIRIGFLLLIIFVISCATTPSAMAQFNPRPKQAQPKPADPKKTEPTKSERIKVVPKDDPVTNKPAENKLVEKGFDVPEVQEGKPTEGKADEQKSDDPKAGDQKDDDANSEPLEKPSPELQSKVQKLLRRLEVDELKERDKAEASLIELGPDILSLIPKKDDAANSAVGKSLDRIRNSLELASVQRTAQPSTITLDGEQSFENLIVQFKKQTGNTLNVQPEVAQQAATKKLKVNFNKTPFWIALDQVLDQIPATVYPYQNGLTINDLRNPAQLPREGNAVYPGPLRVELTSLHIDKDTRSNAKPMMRVVAEISWEPRLHPIVVEHPLASVKAVDNQDKTIKSLRTDGNTSAMVNAGVAAASFDLLLEAPPRAATSLKSFQGSVQLLMTSKTEKFVFENLADEKKKEQKIAQATVTIERIVRNNDLWDFQVKIKFDKTYEALDSHLANWILSNQPKLLDSKGKEIDTAALETSSNNGSEIGMTFSYDIEKLDGCKWIYKSPVMIQQVKYDYEIKNISLP